MKTARGAKVGVKTQYLSLLLTRLGDVVNHAFAKELLMGFAGAEMDKFGETKGMDFMDKEKVKHQTKKQAEHLYDEQYGDMDQYNP